MKAFLTKYNDIKSLTANHYREIGHELNQMRDKDYLLAHAELQGWAEADHRRPWEYHRIMQASSDLRHIMAAQPEPATTIEMRHDPD